MAKKIMDSDILKAISTHLDEESAVYGANGHYAIGAYYDKFDGYEEANETNVANAWKSDNDKLAVYLQNAKWLNW